MESKRASDWSQAVLAIRHRQSYAKITLGNLPQNALSDITPKREQAPPTWSLLRLGNCGLPRPDRAAAAAELTQVAVLAAFVGVRQRALGKTGDVDFTAGDGGDTLGVVVSRGAVGLRPEDRTARVQFANHRVHA